MAWLGRRNDRADFLRRSAGANPQRLASPGAIVAGFKEAVAALPPSPTALQRATPGNRCGPCRAGNKLPVWSGALVCQRPALLTDLPVGTGGMRFFGGY